MAKWSSAQDLVGETLEGRFQLIRLLGEGGMGAVYEGRHMRLDARVAIKVLSRELAEDERQRRRFLREARAAVRIRHDNVVQIIDFGEEPVAYFVMEYLDGIDLAQLLQRTRSLPWDRVRGLILPMMRALGAAHKVGIVHRDVKPSNVFLTHRDGEEVVKVLDFGIAKVADSGVETRGVTRTDEVVGTVAYMSPEQALAHPIDARSDVYSTGILVFELLTGRTPYVASTQYQIMHQHITSPVPSLLSFDPSIPPAVDLVVARALQKRPIDRFPTMDAMLEAFTAIPADAPGANGHRPAASQVPQGHTILGAPGPAPAGGVGPSPSSSPGVGTIAVPPGSGSTPDGTVAAGMGSAGHSRPPLPESSPTMMSVETVRDPVRQRSTAGVLVLLGALGAIGAGVVVAWPSGNVSPSSDEGSLPLSVAGAGGGEGPSAAGAREGKEPAASGVSEGETPSAAKPGGEPDSAASLRAGQGSAADVEVAQPNGAPGGDRWIEASTEGEGTPTNPSDPEVPVTSVVLPREAKASVKRSGTAASAVKTPKRPPSDASLLRKIEAGAKRCEIRQTTSLKFQVMPNGSVLLVQSAPLQPCVEAVARNQTFGPRERPQSFRLDLKP